MDALDLALLLFSLLFVPNALASPSVSVSARDDIRTTVTWTTTTQAVQRRCTDWQVNKLSPSRAVPFCAHWKPRENGDMQSYVLQTVELQDGLMCDKWHIHSKNTIVTPICDGARPSSNDAGKDKKGKIDARNTAITTVVANKTLPETSNECEHWHLDQGSSDWLATPSCGQWSPRADGKIESYVIQTVLVASGYVCDGWHIVSNDGVITPVCPVIEVAQSDDHDYQTASVLVSHGHDARHFIEDLRHTAEQPGDRPAGQHPNDPECLGRHCGPRPGHGRSVVVPPKDAVRELTESMESAAPKLARQIKDIPAGSRPTDESCHGRHCGPGHGRSVVVPPMDAAKDLTEPLESAAPNVALPFGLDPESIPRMSIPAVTITHTTTVLVQLTSATATPDPTTIHTTTVFVKITPATAT